MNDANKHENTIMNKLWIIMFIRSDSDIDYDLIEIYTREDPSNMNLKQRYWMNKLFYDYLRFVTEKSGIFMWKNHITGLLWWRMTIQYLSIHRIQYSLYSSSYTNLFFFEKFNSSYVDYNYE